MAGEIIDIRCFKKFDNYFIFKWVERQFSFAEDYLLSDPEVTPQMRKILTDWLVQVQVMFKVSLFEDCLYMYFSDENLILFSLVRIENLIMKLLDNMVM